MRRGPFFRPFSLFKTTEICFGSTKMGIFYREKKSGKMTLPLLKNIPLMPLERLHLTHLLPLGYDLIIKDDHQIYLFTNKYKSLDLNNFSSRTAVC